MRAQEQIPTTERLFRRLRPDHFIGRQVLPEAVDLRGSSCDREAYRKPEQLVTAEWPGVAYTTTGDLPRAVAPTKEPPTWEYFSVDLPLESNDAHCEVRLRRSGRTEDANDTNAINKRPRLVREELKAALAGSLRLLLPPTGL